MNEYEVSRSIAASQAFGLMDTAHSLLQEALQEPDREYKFIAQDIDASCRHLEEALYILKRFRELEGKQGVKPV
jgi:chromosomal replication initiation ATPase DnaA